MDKALGVARALNVLWRNRKAEAALVASVVTLATQVYHAYQH